MAASARAQVAGKRYRLGLLGTGVPFNEPYYQAFDRRMSEQGFVEGRNLVVERRNANYDLGRMPSLARELVDLKCDVLFGAATQTALAALAAAGRNIPIVYIAIDFDPVTAGFVSSLARPGGNVTGITAQQSIMPAKRLELLKECIPGLDRVAIFSNAETGEQLGVANAATKRLGLTLQVIDFKQPPFDFKAGFDEAIKMRSSAVHVLGSGLWAGKRREIADLALRARLPGMFNQADWVRAGGLLSYGFSFPDMYRRAAEMVAAVFNGARPATMPVEQPTNFELAVNLATARKLRLKIPDSIRIRADVVVE